MRYDSKWNIKARADITMALTSGKGNVKPLADVLSVCHLISDDHSQKDLVFARNSWQDLHNESTCSTVGQVGNIT